MNKRSPTEWLERCQQCGRIGTCKEGCTKPANRCPRCGRLNTCLNGLCTAPPQKTRAEINERHNKWLRKRRQAGLCAKCGHTSRPNRKYCQPCADYVKACNTTWAQRNPDARRTYIRSWTRQRGIELRVQVFTHYGNVCACCGETDARFLTIDHKNSDGHRDPRRGKQRSGGGNWYRKIIKLGFPNDLQLLCWNCNMGKAQHGGICPHQIPKGDA